MNYGRIYESLIERGRNRTLDGYSERHHITPRCLGGSDDAGNIVRLTPEEHFMAHKLLVKLFPRHNGLALAMVAMGWNDVGHRQSRKLFGWMRRRACEAMRDMKLGGTLPQWVKDKISVSRTGLLDTDETKANKSAAAKLLVHTAEHNANISKAKIGLPGVRRGMNNSPEHRERQRQAALGRKQTAETIAKMTATVAKMTPEERSARAHKAWQTKRAKATAK